MIKRMTLLRRREGMTDAAFRDHWAGRHAQLALSLPGVCKYTQNRVEEILWHDGRREPFAVDGIVELFFSDDALMARAQASETGRRLIPEDEPAFLRGWTLCIVETDGPHDHVGVKVLVVLALDRDVGLGAAAERVLRSAKEADCVTAAASNRVVRHASRERLWHEPVPPDLIAAIWFANLAAARSAFHASSGLVASLRGLSRKAIACRCDALPILV